MPSYRWTHLIAVLCGVGGASWGTTVSAFQYPPLSDDINTRNIHGPDAWVSGEMRTSGGINHSPSEFGPAPGMWQRSFDGYPASGDRFPLMTAGSLPGGLSPYGFNSSGMNPPVNQPPYIANNPAFGGNGQSPFGQQADGSYGTNATNGPNGSPNGQQQFNGQYGANAFGPNGSMNQNQFGPNPQGQFAPPGWNPQGNPYGPPQMTAATRTQPKMSWALDTAQQPYVGLLGQVAVPGVYEIEKQGTLLGEMIQEIGGLAKDASGQFRIIRNGRPGQMVSYSEAARFELMAGDLVVADAQAATTSNNSQRGTNAKTASSTAVQIGFVNLIDRPVVLKLRREHASVYEILALMRQDEGLASQIKVIAPPNQRSGGQTRPDVILPSETVLIFPQNSVRTARLAPLPEPFPIKRDDENATQQPTPRANISPDVTQSPRTPQPAVGSWQDSTPLPKTARPVAQPRTEQLPEVAEVPPPPAEPTPAKRAGGVRGAPRSQDRIARDSNMVLAPPAETPDNATSPQPNTIADDPPDEPSLLDASGKRRPIQSADAESSDRATLSAADLDEAESTADKTGSSWSIWPPILTTGVGLLTLIGFSVMLRRRTQAATQPIAESRPPLAVNPRPARRDALDAIINDQLPLSEEQVPLTSPMQFYGRPQPPKTIRMDQRHELPKPHLPEGNGPSAVGRRQDSEKKTQQLAAPKVAAVATQKFRIDRSGATGTGTQVIAPALPKPPTGGPLERALSAVQKQSVQKPVPQNSPREEHGA